MLIDGESKLPMYWQELVITANISDVAGLTLIRKEHLKQVSQLGVRSYWQLVASGGGGASFLKQSSLWWITVLQ